MRIHRLIISAVILAGIGLMLLFPGNTEIARETAADGIHTLRIVQSGAPGFPFGETPCRIYLCTDGRCTETVDIVLRNDGKNAEESNFTVHWEDTGVRIVVSAEEMENTEIILYYRND